MILNRYLYLRANVLTKRPSPRPSPEGEGDDSPAAARHPYSPARWAPPLRGGSLPDARDGIYRTDKTNKTNNKTL